jgi:hypothetical protein
MLIDAGRGRSSTRSQEIAQDLSFPSFPLPRLAQTLGPKVSLPQQARPDSGWFFMMSSRFSS